MHQLLLGSATDCRGPQPSARYRYIAIGRCRMALPIRRREVVGFSDPGGEAYRFSLRVRLPSLVPSRDPTVALRPRVHVISERMPGRGAFEEGVRKRLQPDGL